jgi:RNA polymerase sigma-70 factor (ECF subfamily)
VNPPFDVEQQLQLHGRALRGLARELLHDGNAADDAAQEVWVQALRSAPRHGASPGGWLRTVLVNVVARLRRSERRRARHEAVGAARRGGVAEDHAAVLAREEIAQRLLVAVRELEPLYGDAIWARFFEDRTPREIAAATSESVATVKSRLQRGLGILRERLGGGDGARSDWRAVLATAFGLQETTATAASSAIVGGGVFVAMWSKAFVVAAALALVAVWWWPRDVVAPGSADVAGGIAAAPAAANVSTVAPVAAVQPDAAREAIAPVAPAPRTNTTTVRGRCVDEAGVPVAGCVVALHGSSRSRGQLDAWLRDHADPQWRDPEAVITRTDGAFAIAFEPPPPFQFSLTFTAAGMAMMHGNWRAIATGCDVALGEVVLRPACAIRLRVLDSDGAPCPEAQGSVENEIRTDSVDGVVQCRESLSGACRADGRAEFSALVAGRYSVRATDGVRQSERRIAVVGRGQPEAEVTLQLPGPRPLTITGRVVDEQGVAVRNARIMFAASGPVNTRADGGFRLMRPANDASDATTLEVTAEGFARLAVAEPIAWGSAEVELRVRRSGGLALSVRDPEGALVLDYTVRCLPGAGVGSRLHTGADSRVRARGPFVDGVALVPDVSGGTWRLVLEFPASAKLPVWIDDVTVPAEGGRIDVQLPAPARRTVHVVTRAGEPVAASQVQVIETSMSEPRASGPGWVMGTARWLASSGPGISRIVCESATDARGRCEVQGRPGRTYTVRVLGPGHAPLALESVSVDATDELTVEVSKGARLSGRITPADALTRLEQYDATQDGRRMHLPALRLRADAGGRAFSTFTDAGEVDHPHVAVAADGTYVFDGQAAGRWRIVVEFMRASGSGGSTRDSAELGTIELADGEEVRRDLDLTWLMPAWLEAEVTWNGERFANASIWLESTYKDADGTTQGWSTWRQRTDANGAFRVVVRPGAFEVVLSADAEGHDTRALWCPVPAVVAAGRTTSHRFEITTGRAELTVLDAAGKPVEGVVVFLGDARRHLPATDATGHATSEVVAGTWSLRLLPKDLATNVLGPHGYPAIADEDAFAGKWIELGAAVVAPGRTTKQELRVPSTLEK